MALATVGLLTIVHFVRGGVPALSGTAEVSRFDLGSSGLLGMPSRSVLYGLPVLCLAFSALGSRLPPHLGQIAWGLLVASRLAMGFKGGMVDAGVIYLTALLLQPTMSKARLTRAGALVAAGSVGYGVWIGSHYSTIVRTGGMSLRYMADRMSIMAAEPGWLGLELGRMTTAGESILTYDLRYFADRYFHITTGPDFAWDQLVSSFITGTPRAGDYFLVPVTTGAPAYLALSVPPSLVLVVVGIIGVLWGRSERQLITAGHPVRCLAAATGILALRLFLLNGAGAYVAINLSFTFGFILTLYTLPLVPWRRLVTGVGRSRVRVAPVSLPAAGP
ncbi:MAG: hypothetical protein U0Q19_07010 [Kineosporiaceae bacterium]